MQAAQCSSLWCNGAQPLQKNVVVGQATDENLSHRLLSHCQLISSEMNFFDREYYNTNRTASDDGASWFRFSSLDKAQRMISR